jgi:4-diphosphocytidyl-2-C-methyl-D-erythritol kinase
MLYDVPAPAKLNLFLHVVGRRPDGYHLLQTVFRFVGLADTLHFDTRRDGGIGRAAELAGVACADDLTLRAAHALQQATGTRLGVQITLEKRIPTGGGLGGGSSDAASVLIALNRLWNTGLTRAELMRLALPLGADVPVFLFGQSAFGQGVGEDLTAVALPPAAYLIVQPDASVPTADIFRSPDLTRDTESIKIADFPGHLNLRNDLAPVVYRRYPEILRAKVWLEKALAKAEVQENARQSAKHQIRLSGSGACLFAEFADIEHAVLAEQEIIATMRVSDCIYFAKDEMQVRFRSVRASPGLVEHPLRHWIAD